MRRQDLGARAAELGGERLDGLLVLLRAVHDDAGALGRRGARQRRAEPAPAAGDEDTPCRAGRRSVICR